jgi:hypothetical protein
MTASNAGIDEDTFMKNDNLGKELRQKYGVFGLSIIQIVGLILILSLVATLVYEFMH